jgi:hypothetical protein
MADEATSDAADGDATANELRRAFVAGAQWWEYVRTGSAMGSNDLRLVEAEGERRHPAEGADRAEGCPR